MKLAKIVTAIALTATMAMPLAGVANAKQSPETKALMKQMMSAASKAGAMKRKLTGEVEEAKTRAEKIQELRAEIEKLKSEIDEVLAAESDEYRQLLEQKEKLAAEYKAAKKADAAKE